MLKRYEIHELKRLSFKRKGQKKRHRCYWQAFQTRPREQAPYAFGLLSFVHNLHFGGFSL